MAGAAGFAPGGRMDSFEFAFSLFGLVLGLSVAEIVSGFARVLRERQAIRLGWLTPLLGLLLFVDLVTFWTGAWALRSQMSVDFETLLLLTTVAAIYFLSASLVFPRTLPEWPDLDAFFLRHKGQVMAGVIAANLLMQTYYTILLGAEDLAVRAVVAVVFTSLGVGLIFAKGKWTSGILLGVLLSLYFIIDPLAEALAGARLFLHARRTAGHAHG